MMRQEKLANYGIAEPDQATATLEKRAQPGYYPRFDTLSQQAFWDETTRKVVLSRLEKPGPLKFFTPEQCRLMQTVLDRILPQDDRDEQHRIPLLPPIDQRLYSGRIDGYRFENMPPDRAAYHLGLEAIGEMATSLYNADFSQMTVHQQEELLRSLHDGKPRAAHSIWAQMPVDRFWMMILQDAIEAYYAHPFAWNEIGFGGPAYPRAYIRLERGEPEPWEVEEQRYEWNSPAGTLSEEFTPVGGKSEQLGSPGQGGTH